MKNSVKTYLIILCEVNKFATLNFLEREMPTYDYKCLVCGYDFEVFQKMTDDPLNECPECSGEVKRLIGAGLGPIFKGTGFYQTDYKSNGGAKESKSSGTGSKAETPKDTKTESKPKEKPAS